jgi:hypothetical protein
VESNFSPDVHTKAGTLGGMLLALFLQIHSGDVMKTIVLAAVGGLVSFGVSFGLKMLIRWIHKRSM